MSPSQNEAREIRPVSPDDNVRGLLVLSLAQVLPLAAGAAGDGYGKTGEYVLVAAVRGNLTVTSHAQYALLQPGQVMVLKAPGAYTIQAVSDCQCMVVKLQGELADRLLPRKLTDGAVVLSRCASAVREAVMALEVMEDHAPVSGTVASAHAYWLLMKLEDIWPQEGAEAPTLSPLVDSAIAIIQEEFLFLESLDELAHRLEVSKAHLIRSFTQKTGISPGKYITRLRIDYAKLLLQEKDTSISYVAEASGFANANYFAKVFRKQTGMSPSEYMDTAVRPTEQKPRRETTLPVW
jgi:AraC-like DNA-binding protein